MVEKSRTRGVLRAKGGWEKSRTTRLLHVFHVRSGDFLSSLFFFFFFSFVPFFIFSQNVGFFLFKERKGLFSRNTTFPRVCVCVPEETSPISPGRPFSSWRRSSAFSTPPSTTHTLVGGLNGLASNPTCTL